jgi:transketolase
LRTAFVTTLCDIAAEDKRILLLTGDLGFMALEPFRDRFPGRFINAGVAEQNMLGLATGLAEAGYRPYVYSIATFASLRSLEFIRNGPVLHRLPVRVVGMGMGFEYGHAGSTHHAVEDVAVLRTLPGLTVVIPADPEQTVSALRGTQSLTGPAYYSLGKDDRLTVPGLLGRFELGRIQVLQSGGSVAIVAMGSVSREAVAAADALDARGVRTSVAIVSNFSPNPESDLVELLSGIRHVFSVEAQTLSGGLGAFVASAIACHGLPCKLRMLGVRASPDGTSGSQRDRWRKHGLDQDSIVASVLEVIG